MAQTTVILFYPVIEHMRGWSGDIGRAVFKLTAEMALAQGVLAPKKTGRLLESIGVDGYGQWARGIETFVGANPARGRGKRGYGFWTDQGTLPHRITPRPENPHGWLIFFWPKVGRVVHFRSVNHPGIKMPRHWAERGAGAAMRAWH